MSNTELRIETSPGDQPTVKLTGVLDIVSADPTAETIIGLLRPGGAVVVDLSGVSFLDSSGVRALVTAKRKAETDGADVILRSLSDPARRIIELTRLDQVFTITD